MRRLIQARSLASPHTKTAPLIQTPFGNAKLVMADPVLAVGSGRDWLGFRLEGEGYFVRYHGLLAID